MKRHFSEKMQRTVAPAPEEPHKWASQEDQRQVYVLPIKSFDGGRGNRISQAGNQMPPGQDGDPWRSFPIDEIESFDLGDGTYSGEVFFRKRRK